MRVELGDLKRYSTGFLKELAQYCEDMEALKKLGEDPNEFVRAGAAGNAKNSPENLDKLSRNYSWIVRCTVASNARTSIETCKRLAQDNDPEVRELAKKTLKSKCTNYVV